MKATPLPNGSNGRNANGTFGKGNSGGPGNPYARQSAHFKKLLLGAVSDAAFKQVVKAILQRAKKGEPAAVNILLDRLLGKVVMEEPQIDTTAPRSPVDEARLAEYMKNPEVVRHKIALANLWFQRQDNP